MVNILMKIEKIVIFIGIVISVILMIKGVSSENIDSLTLGGFLGIIFHNYNIYFRGVCKK